MVKNKIILIVMILLIPVALADFITITSEIPPKTSNNKLCVSGSTNSGNTIRFYIDESPRKIILTDGTERDDITLSDGIIDNLCITLHTGENNVKITSTGQYDIIEKEFTINYDNTAPGLSGLDIPNIINNKNPAYTVNINEDAILIITVNGQEDRTSVNQGEQEITLNLNEGENTVKVEIEDSIGNKQTILEKTITVDTNKPFVIINSIDGNQYTSGMKTDFSITKIIGKAEKDVNLKVINLFDNDSYYYDEDEDKFLKGDEEITSKSVNTVELDEGNFETYVKLLPGKNTIVFLATDSTGNKNTIAQDVNIPNNIAPTLILNYEGGSENWNIRIIPPSKIKAKDMLNEIPARIEIRASLKKKNIDPEQLTIDGFSIPPPDITKGDNRVIRLNGQATHYYDNKKKEYIIHQDAAIKWPGRYQDIPNALHAILDGNIHFRVGDSTQPLREHMPIELLFHVDVEQTKLLSPFRITFSQANINGYLKNIEKIVKGLQTVIKWNAIACVIDLAIHLFMWTPPTRETWAICDRLLCWDTPPRVDDPRIYPAAGLRTYIGGGPLIYDETKCFPNMFRAKPIFAPVRVTDDLVESTKCLCLTGIWTHLQKMYQTLSAMQGCLERSRLGTKDLGECEVQIAQYSCDILFGFVNKINKQVYGDIDIFNKPDMRPYNFDRKPIGAVRGFITSMSSMSRDLQKITQFNYLDPLAHKACTILASQDWESVKDIVIPAGVEYTPSYGKLIVKSKLIEESGDLVIEYRITPIFLAGLHDVRYEITFDCDTTDTKNNYLCAGMKPEDKRRYTTDLQSDEGILLKSTLPAGASLPGIIRVKDIDPEYWFNKAKLTLTRYVTVTAQQIPQTIESDIKILTERTKMLELCRKQGYKDNKLCAKIK